MKKIIFFLNLVFVLSAKLKRDDKGHLKFDNLNFISLGKKNRKSVECPIENCLSCTEDLTKTCSKCVDSHVLVDGRCYNSDGLSKFMDDLKASASSKEKSVLEFVMKNIIPKDNSTSNSDQEQLPTFLKFERVGKDLNSIRELLSNLRLVSERECKMRINEFVVDFEQNMQVLMSLANLFEQKTIFEVEKKRNSIIQIINSESLTTGIKLDLVNKQLEDLSQMVINTFEAIKTKIKSYQDISEKKILRTKNSFMNKIKKFLE